VSRLLALRLIDWAAVGRLGLGGGIREGQMLVEAAFEAVKGWCIDCRGREVVPGRCHFVI